MKCKCSLNNNYEVIGFCDVKKFNEKISQFEDNSWTQISISQKLILPSKKPDIKSIMKIYVDIKITSSKIIQTPYDDNPSIEGLKLTGKLLLVSGITYQNIIYISDNTCDSIHSVKFNIPFSSYIVIDEDTDLQNDYYCVYPCIEYVFVKPLDERTLSKSLVVFLFAHKTIETPPVEKLPNAFIFKTHDTDKKMAQVEFNKEDMKLIAKSKGIFYGDSTVATAFTFKLSDSSETQVKATSTIGGNQNADNFQKILNDITFEYDDIINIFFDDKSKVVITDYLGQNTNYEMISNSKQSFVIKTTGIIPNILKNTIALNDANDNPVVIIEFDISNKTVLVKSTGKITTSTGGSDYFIMTLCESDGETEKHKHTIEGGNNGDLFSQAFNDFDFDWDDVIKIEYEENDKVTITNFPNSQTSIYNPSANKLAEAFKITQSGLATFELPPPPIKDIPEVFVFRSVSTSKEMANVKFDKDNKKLVVTSTGISYGTGSEVAFSFELKDSSQTQIKGLGIILSNGNADDFKSKLDQIDFENHDLISLKYLDISKVFLARYSDTGDVYEMQSSFAESFKITENGIIPYTLQNKIILKNTGNEPVVTIGFNMLNNLLSVNYLGYVSNPGGINYFKMTLFKNDGKTEKVTSNVEGNSIAEEFEITFMDEKFSYGDIIKLEYEEANMVVITNFPTIRNLIYNPKGNEEWFKITSDGLISFT